jgi:hypothetical protein
MLPTIETIIQGTVDTISELSGIGQVGKQQGAQSPWAKAPGQKQCFWIVTHEQSQASSGGVGGTVKNKNVRVRRIVIDAWMPWSVGIRTGEAFRDKVNDVEWQLTTNKGLGVCAKMLSLPNLDYSKVEPYSSLNVNDEPRICHHARISFDVIAHHTTEGD